MTIHVDVNKANIRWNSRDIIRIAQHVSLYAVAAPACIMYYLYYTTTHMNRKCVHAHFYIIYYKQKWVYISRYDDDGHINTMYTLTHTRAGWQNTYNAAGIFVQEIRTLSWTRRKPAICFTEKLTPYACMCSFVWYRFDPFIEIGS